MEHRREYPAEATDKRGQREETEPVAAEPWRIRYARGLLARVVGKMSQNQVPASARRWYS